MPRERNLSLQKYDISNNRYKELYYFCLQYDEKKNRLYSLSSELKAESDETEAIKRSKMAQDLEIIEQCAIEAAGGELYQYLLKNVADGIRFENLFVPCGRRQFYNIRRQFYILLSQKK